MASKIGAKSGTARCMGRKPKWGEEMRAAFPEGTLARIEIVLRKKDGKRLESQKDFVWTAVERELQRREKPKKG